MIAYKLDNALVAKYPTSEERRATSSNGGKASANKPNGGKASANEPTSGQASAGEIAPVSTTAKHP